MSKTILVISPEFPYPPTQGSKHDIWGHVTFFHRFDWRVILVICGPKISNIKLPIDIDLHFIHRCSHYQWLRKEKPETIDKVQKLIDFYSPQLVWCEYAHFASLASALNLNEAKLWFRPHNFELAQELDRTLAEPPWNTWKGYNAPKQALKWARNFLPLLWHIFTRERLMYHIADRLFFISHSDLRFMSRLYRKNIHKYWLPTFLECDQIPVKENKNPLDVIYIGAYDHKPNRAGTYMLLHELIPAIEAAMPNAFRFHIVGKGNHKHFGSYSSKSVIIYDFVPDLSALLQEMDIACLPVKFGWGCKIKMMEALASGLPVVGANQAFRGLPEIEGIYYACNTTQDYVKALMLLQAPDKRKHTAMAGKEAYAAWLDRGKHLLHDALKDTEKINSAYSGYPNQDKKNKITPKLFPIKAKQS